MQKACPLLSGAGGASLLVQGQARQRCVDDFARSVEYRICNMPMDAERLLLTKEYLKRFWRLEPSYNLSNLPFTCELADE